MLEIIETLRNLNNSVKRFVLLNNAMYLHL